MEMQFVCVLHFSRRDLYSGVCTASVWLPLIQTTQRPDLGAWHSTCAPSVQNATQSVDWHRGPDWWMNSDWFLQQDGAASLWDIVPIMLRYKTIAEWEHASIKQQSQYRPNVRLMLLKWGMKGGICKCPGEDLISASHCLPPWLGGTLIAQHINLEILSLLQQFLFFFPLPSCKH